MEINFMLLNYETDISYMIFAVIISDIFLK